MSRSTAVAYHLFPPRLRVYPQTLRLAPRGLLALINDFAADFLRGCGELAARWTALLFWEQEIIKVVGLVAIVLVTIMILGDIYRGEI